MLCRCVVAPREEGETIRLKLSEQGFLRKGVKLDSDGEYVYIPITDEVEVEYPTVEREMEETETIASYQELLDLEPHLQELLPTSFDVIGDIFILKLEEELLPYSTEIGEAILKANKNAAVVALDKGVQGEFRTRDLEGVAGEDRTTTIHKEFDLRYEMDLAKVYFSPRLATERKKVADFVEKGERVIDMFAGVGPFSLLIAKTAEPAQVYSIDKNVEAINYMVNNIRLNKVKNVAPMLGDARDMVMSLKAADRVIMNLPHSSLDFLDAGLAAVKPVGWIHLYYIAERADLHEVDLLIKSFIEQKDRSLESMSAHEVHTYSPSSSLYCFDIVVG